MLDSELHLFIIWEKGRKHEVEILKEIEKVFLVKQTFSITWSPYYAGRNFTRFYGQSLPKDSHKELHCGSGEFKLIVVEDINPVYEDRKTSKGNRTVNINMFDTKSKVRKITGGGHKVHGTDNERETKHDLVLLIGLSKKDFLVQYVKPRDDIKLRHDLIGTNGWKDFNELFYVLNECSDYIVLRNALNINLKYFQKNKGDIDILAKDASEIKYVLGDVDSIRNHKSHLKVDIDKNIILFEVDQYGSNLFDIKFENDLFNSKILTNNIYHPSKELEMYVLIYHALLYKKSLEEKHKTRILNQYSQYFDKNKNLEKQLLSLLITYFKDNEYRFTTPNYGYFNFRPEIKNLLKINKNREYKIIKKFVSIKLERRYFQIIIFKFIKKLFSLDIVLPFSIRFKLNIGLK